MQPKVRRLVTGSYIHSPYSWNRIPGVEFEMDFAYWMKLYPR